MIQGLAGNDTLDGGFGIDTVSYASAARGFTVNLATGTAVGGSEVDTLAGYESVRGTRYADSITGDAKDNRFVGADGNDTLNGGGGLDTADYASATSAVTVAVNQSYSGGTGRSANGAEGLDTLVGIEGVIGSAYADVISDGGYSYGLANRFDGGAGNDRLLGGGGSDTLAGGAGNDTLDGGANTSVSDVDVADYSGALSAIAGSLAGVIQGTSTGTDRLGNFEAIIATAYADNLSGSAVAERMEGGAGADTLSGGGGNDKMTGGGGSDTYHVNSTNDVVTEGSAYGTDTVVSSINYALGANVENLTLTGTAATGTGNGLNNLLAGNSRGNTLRGGAGNDTLQGGLGRDTLDGGTGTHADRFVFTGVADSRVGAADRIENFNAAYDVLDLGAIDANSRADHDQSFAFLGTGSFTGSAGQLRYQVRTSDTMVYGDVDGDKVADFAIQIVGQHHLGISDFVL